MLDPNVKLHWAADQHTICALRVCLCVTAGHLANAATELMKLDHEEPQLTEPYLSKQKKLMVGFAFILKATIR